MTAHAHNICNCGSVFDMLKLTDHLMIMKNCRQATVLVNL